MEDSILAKEAINSSDCFRILITRYEDALFRYIKRISFFTDPEIEDILQEVYVKVYKNLNSFDTSLKFSSWIYRITHNETVDVIRKNSKNYNYNFNDDVWYKIADDINLSKNIESDEMKEKIIEEVRKLPLKYREILYLRFVEEKSYEEIVDILKKPKGTVSTLINRGRKILQLRLNNI